MVSDTLRKSDFFGYFGNIEYYIIGTQLCTQLKIYKIKSIKETRLSVYASCQRRQPSWRQDPQRSKYAEYQNDLRSSSFSSYAGRFRRLRQHQLIRTDTGSAKGTITVWGWDSGNSMNQTIAEFEKENPGITVKFNNTGTAERLLQR